MSQFKLSRKYKVVESLLTLFSCLGAGVLSLGYWEGFYFYIIANVCGLILFSHVRWYPSLIRQAVFTITSLVGIWNNLL